VGVACGDGLLWDAGKFSEAYRRNRQAATAALIEDDLVADAVRSFMRQRESDSRLVEGDSRQWRGKATDLHDALTHFIGEHAHSKDWPATPRKLRSCLQRVQAPLRKIGIEITFMSSSHKRTSIEIINRNAPTQ